MTALPESEVKIVVYIEEPLTSKQTHLTPTALGWPQGFFERFAGCLSDVDLEEPDDLPPEPLEDQ